MIGLFQELGPCTVNSSGDVVDNPYSWSNVSNMLFIDQPTQVGFSYSEAVPAYVDDYAGFVVVLPNETCPDYAQDSACGTYSLPYQDLTANTTNAAAPNMWKTIQGFMGAFPQYSRNDFYFATESYGGHYAPIFNDYILDQNAKEIEGAAKINLAAVLIGNGWYDPLIQYEAFYNYSIYPGNTYDYNPFNESMSALFYNGMYGRGNCYDLTVSCNENGWNSVCAYADNFCLNNVENIWDIVTDRDEYDIRYLNPNPFPPTYYVDYLNTPEVQDAIGAYVNFTEANYAVGQDFENTGDDDRELGTVAAVKRIYDSNVTMIHYYGDADYVCNWIGGQVIAKNVGATGFDDAGFANISTSDDKVHGQVKQAGTFAFVRIYESGHEVPFYQPLIALEMFERVVKGLDIETGKVNITASYRTEGTATSEFREGNSTVQLAVVGQDDDVVYDVETALPVYENGTSANTGPGSGNSTESSSLLSKRSVTEALDNQQVTKQRRGRAQRWRPDMKRGFGRRNGAMPIGRGAFGL
jgi:carboxypeptidase C (cathepsin A)